ncbi:acyl-CoA dehydrogenase family protein [Kribbia dieselivorans]|uniref:acyl-CoA dehydrogenase family protein n=1 Tax=Kribbia dieselivorans TaxID=331526 RepID=UPI00083831BD|nr:acyl-CoA dehydrogenase family protein [Kribbia dieselivorans]
MTTDTTDLSTLAVPVAADPDLVGMMTDLFTAYREARTAPDQFVVFDESLWGQLEELGLTRLTAATESGGSGASWLEGAALLTAAAGAAAPVPLVEHGFLAAWLLEQAGLPNDGALRTVALPDAQGQANSVLYGRHAAAVVALWHDGAQWRVADVPAARVTITEGHNLAGEPADTVSFEVADLGAGAVVRPEVRDEFQRRGALARSLQNVGSAERALELVLTHVNERAQFGRPIGKFQAVQHLVADIAAESALARAATDTAVARAVESDWADPGVPFAVAAAASCTGHAASVIVRNAHQAMGAIGTTLEHELHLMTKPMLARRGEFGTVHEWDETLTAMAVAAGREGLWPLVLTGTTA